MPRNMSFMLTTEQAWNKTKWVTRRCGWWFLKPGDIVQQVVQAQGLKKGETVKRIHRIMILNTMDEPLKRMTDDPVYGRAECILEGFPEMGPEEFVKMFCRHNGCPPDEIINRIAFGYIED